MSGKAHALGFQGLCRMEPRNEEFRDFPSPHEKCSVSDTSWCLESNYVLFFSLLWEIDFILFVGSSEIPDPEFLVIP